MRGPLAGATALCLLALSSIKPAQGQGTTFDGSLSYAARDEVTDQDNPDQSLDNDIFRVTGAVTWDVGDGRMRAALEAGVRNEDFSGDAPLLGGAELDFARRVGDKRYALYGRLRGDEDLSVTTELGYGLQHLGTRVDLRGLVGFQLVADASKVRGRSAASAFGLGEATYYVTPNWAVSVGLQGDIDGAVWAGSTEYRPRRWGGLSMFVAYAEAFDKYRDVVSYDTLSAGFRWVPGAGNSLRAQRQFNLGVVTQRFVEVQ
ncbi:MAG: hypothetical protein AAGH83_08510 [Pseudomonadota bacterium]